MSVYSNNVKNKLLVMFFINEMNTPLLGYQLEDYFVDNVLIETIELHTIMAELTELDFIKTESVFGRTYYTVTAKGKDALESLETGLTETSRDLIREYCKQNKARIKNENNVVTHCQQTADGAFELVLTLLNNTKPLMELKLLIDDEDFAVQATKNWANASTDLYAHIVNTLLADNE